ncbi:MAG: SUMF1/EgtB/PvdO family nonheme iron enzyme [Planctomycetia bacterium]
MARYSLVAVLMGLLSLAITRREQPAPAFDEGAATAALMAESGLDRISINSIGVKLLQFQAPTASAASAADGKAVEEIAVGVHEVTHGQFRLFADATGYVTEIESTGRSGWGFDAALGRVEFGPQYNWRNTGFPQDADFPVFNITWKDAEAFCSWLGATEGAVYRLPTEEDLVLASRGDGLAADGPAVEGVASGDPFSELDRFAWHWYSSVFRTHPMLRWTRDVRSDIDNSPDETLDWRHSRYADAPGSEVEPPVFSEMRRHPDAERVRFLLNAWNLSTQRFNTLGFRVVRTAKRNPTPAVSPAR